MGVITLCVLFSWKFSISRQNERDIRETYNT